MQKTPEFLQAFEQEGAALIEKGAVKRPLFSQNTYQFEVKEPRKKEPFFPFLQVSDNSQLGDAFCTCKQSELGAGCPHLAAAYLKIHNHHPEPLHVRFKRSIWNQLFQMECEELGPESSCIAQEGNSFMAPPQKPVFTIQAKTLAIKKQIEKIIKNRAVETEETSIKFFNLPSEEIALYKAGNPSAALRYELSFWSDLAKWLMFLEEEHNEYEIAFVAEQGELPHTLGVRFPDLEMQFAISAEQWPRIIPTLAYVRSPLQVFDSETEGIEKIEYDPGSKKFLIFHKSGERGHEIGGIQIGDWRYVEGAGFYKRHASPLFQRTEIGAHEIADMLSNSAKILQKHLPIYQDPIPAKYRLHFDSQANLHIELYVHKVGDLMQEGAALFLPYAYLPGQGFFHLSELIFEGIEKIIPKAEVPEFVSRHRLWLHQFPGFQTHLGSLEAHLTYTFNGELRFDAKLDFPEQFEETIDFQEWVYIKGSGFYMKKDNRGRLPLYPGLRLKKPEIAAFLASHKEDLEQVQGFFTSLAIIQRFGLEIGLNEEGLITLTPKIEYQEGISPSDVQVFGDFAYLAGSGFSEIPLSFRLPERYRTEQVISPSQESAFLAYELEPLKPHILHLDPRLQKSQHLQLKIRKIQRDRKRRTGEWLIDLVYASELGTIDIFSIWDAFQAKKKHLFSPAGLLSLKDPRFNWLRGLPKRRLDRKRGMLRINTLEWIRLSVFEEISPPKGHDPESMETRQLLEEIQRFETHRLLDISALKAQLRPYQELGLQWLWFLYCHGLSGLLCDDMGLGKTHQTMALLAAVIHENKEKDQKYLVVCPTSVIYHWQELLKRFLPTLRVCTYYGLARTLDSFETQYDLLLTSYGILRTGKESLAHIRFEIAIFDEIQIAKNSASQTHRALRAINATMRLGLTGTPIENRIREIKSLMDVVLPGYMPPESVFREIFITPIEKGHDEEKKVLLGKLIKPFILRRKKSEVLLDLPEKIEEVAYCDLSPEQKMLYKETATALRNTVYAELQDNTKPVSYVHVFSALSRLKQICDHPSLITGDIKRHYEHQSGKWDLFVELLQEARDSGQKIVVFSQYLDMLAIIEEHLKKKGIGFATIKGSTRDRREQLLKFREDPSCEVFTASLLAAGVGIDLTVASIVIHYDRWWNPAKENQATDRVHRIGQNRGVQVFKLVTKHTIEEHIHTLIERKLGLMEDVIGGDEADHINYLSRQELLQIFEKIYTETT